MLKRHCDTIFRHKLDVAPISMIITNSAAHAYGGETDLHELLRRYPELRIVPADDLLVLRGDLAFRVVGPNEDYLEDS